MIQTTRINHELDDTVVHLMLFSSWSKPAHFVRRIIEDTFGEYPPQAN